MLKTLIKKQCRELFQTFYIDRKSGKARGKNALIRYFILMGVVFVLLGLAFYGVAFGLGVQILGKENNWVYFAFMGLITVALGLFGSVFSTYASLYLPKDNDFLFSLPIPVNSILISRIFGVYLMGFVYGAAVWIPTMIAYWKIVKPDLFQIIFPILLLFFLALFIAVLSCILGFVVAAISKKIKGKSFVKVFICLLFIALYFYFYSKASNLLTEFVKNLDSFSAVLQSKIYYIYLLGKGADGEILSLLLYALITVLLSGICFAVLSKTFVRLAGVKESSSKVRGKRNHYVANRPDKALLKRELKHFTSVTTWMLNDGFGLIVLVAAAVAVLLVKSTILGKIEEVTAVIPTFSSSVPVLVLIACCIVITTNGILSVSISIEGKCLYLLQSLPVSPWKILRAKEKMGFVLNVIPVMLFVIACSVALGIGIAGTVIILIASILYICLVSDFCLYLNLKKPNFTWTNPAYLTKQSEPVTLNLFCGWGFCLVLGILGLFLPAILPATVILIVYCVLFLILYLILHSWLKKTGTKILQEL